jgi:hypothetical protein
MRRAVWPVTRPLAYQLGPLAALWAYDREVNAVWLNGCFRPPNRLTQGVYVFVLSHGRQFTTCLAGNLRSREIHGCLPEDEKMNIQLATGCLARRDFISLGVGRAIPSGAVGWRGKSGKRLSDAAVSQSETNHDRSIVMALRIMSTASESFPRGLR